MKTRRQKVSEEDRLPIPRRNKRSKTSPEESQNLFPVPIDLTVEILSRLPLRAIALCRCVSKLWASTLRHPDITESLLTKSSAQPQLLFTCLNYEDNVLFFSKPEVQNPATKFSFNGAPFSFCGHVRGLTCVTYQRILEGRNEIVPVICNPSTGQSFHLPKLKTRRGTGTVESFFGYDPIDKQLKILSMTSAHSRFAEVGFFGEHQVLTLGTRKLSWRKIECNILHGSSYNKVCVNGSLYYQTMNNFGLSVIVRFDVRHEKLRVIKKPDVVARNFNLINYKGQLGAFLSDGSSLVNGKSKSFELWVLVDAAKHEWVKYVYQLPPLWQTVVEDGLSCVGVTTGNEFVFSPRSIIGHFYVIYYHPESKTIRRIEVQGMDARNNDLLGTSLDHIEDVRLDIL